MCFLIGINNVVRKWSYGGKTWIIIKKVYVWSVKVELISIIDHQHATLVIISTAETVNLKSMVAFLVNRLILIIFVNGEDVLIVIILMIKLLKEIRWSVKGVQLSFVQFVYQLGASIIINVLSKLIPCSIGSTTSICSNI